MLIFISGPYSAASILDQEQNVERAMLAADVIFRLGHLPVCPHLTHFFDLFVTAYLGEPPTYERYMALALEQVRRADGLLYLAPSPGADRELALARELSLPVWLSVDEIPAGEAAMG